ncbi:HD domain-containing protein [Candidatus Micrarchaeota archaeon]|nr:HD domain-containing protein [Candidatus Micrarchaeota archaeon]
MEFNVPVKENYLLEKIRKRIGDSVRLQAFWRVSNVNSIERMKYNDHGPVHVKITANIALKMLRLLHEKGILSSVEKDYSYSYEDAEVVVVLASVLHDVGNAFCREGHEVYSLGIASDLLDELLEGYGDLEKRTVLKSEILHAVLTHEAPRKPLTLEAGIVRIADALDMAEGRARLPFKAGRRSIHSISAIAVKRIELRAGEKKPVEVRIFMDNPSGVFQTELLSERINGSGLEAYMHVIAEINDNGAIEVMELH